MAQEKSLIIYLLSNHPRVLSGQMSKKRYVVVVPEKLHYRLRQTALKRKFKLSELVEKLLWEALNPKS